MHINNLYWTAYWWHKLRKDIAFCEHHCVPVLLVIDWVKNLIVLIFFEMREIFNHNQFK